MEVFLLKKTEKVFVVEMYGQGFIKQMVFVSTFKNPIYLYLSLQLGFFSLLKCFSIVNISGLRVMWKFVKLSGPSIICHVGTCLQGTSRYAYEEMAS